MFSLPISIVIPGLTSIGLVWVVQALGKSDSLQWNCAGADSYLLFLFLDHQINEGCCGCCGIVACLGCGMWIFCIFFVFVEMKNLSHNGRKVMSPKMDSPFFLIQKWTVIWYHLRTGKERGGWEESRKYETLKVLGTQSQHLLLFFLMKINLNVFSWTF